MSAEKIIRINKVLRELNISLERAVDFLKDKNIIIEASPSTKISDDVYSLLCSQFAGGKGNKEALKSVSEDIRKEKEALRIEREKEIEDKRKQEKKRQQQELIKAKAVVTAPKQVGIIDLEPKADAKKEKNEVQTTDETLVEETHSTQYQNLAGTVLIGQKIDLTQFYKPKAKKIIKNDEKLFVNGNIVKVKISKIIAPSQIITDYVGGYIGRLSLIDIAWSLPESEQIFKKYKVGDSIECVIFNVDENSKQVIITQKHLSKQLIQTVKWERLERGDEFDVEIIQDLNNTYLVQTKNKLFGVVRKSLLNNQTKELRLKINSKFEESSLIDFVPSHQEQFDDFEIEEPIKDNLNFIEEELQSFNKFKKTLLAQNATDKQIQIIKNGFDLDTNIFSKEIDTGITLYVQFLLNSSAFETDFKQKAIPFYLNQVEYNIENEKAILEILSNQKYWIKINKRSEENIKNNKRLIEILDFSIYNEEINLYGFIEIFKDNKNVKFGITNFSIGQNLGFASKIKKDSAKNGSFLFNNKLKVVSPLNSLPFDNSQKQFLDYCLTKLECFEIIEKLRLDTGEILKQEGRTLAIIDKFLEYQISLINNEKENSIFVASFEKINSSLGGISIKLPKEIGDKLELEEGTILNVQIKIKDKLLKLSDGSIIIQDENYIFNFNRDILVSQLENGFYLDKKISTWQFDIQREIIKDFLEKKIKIDHIESLLVNPSKVKTPVLKNIHFKNSDLVRTEIEQADNIQVRAVKKAVGNQNVFLVQGPPGTGKTTVIAEIIEQLTANNEKILVSGQNHVAVDNVLEKIAKNPNLNLLRVGNHERVDKNLLRYCYNYLVEEYKIDYKSFIRNQKILTEVFLEFVKKEMDKKDFLEGFNLKVNELTKDYIYLQETFKQKHFILRDSLVGLSIKELLETIEALSHWENSFNNEYEILLQPLIYNSVDVVFATCIGIKGDKIFKESNFKFDTVIIDEAGKANIAETLVAIELGKKVILVGDQMQLPPYMDSSLIDKEDQNSFPNSIYREDYQQDEITHALKTSFFEFLINRIDSKQFPSENKEMLNYQHRMHPNIGNFVSESFYGSKVFMGGRTHLHSLVLPSPFEKEIIFFDTSNSKNPFEQKDISAIKNDTEAEFITEFILPKLLESNIKSENIAIIAPYKFQVANIKEYIKKSIVCQNKNIDVATLDSFQGKEYDIIIFSFTRSTDHNKAKTIDGKKKYIKVGFLDDARRLNVAFSRAKKKLILVGNEATLTDSRSHYDGLFNYTNLFRKLVQLSKNSEIGNFVNIVDFDSGASPFEKIVSKYQEGDPVKGTYKSLGLNKGKFFGAFFYVDGLECLLPASFMSIQFKNEVKLLEFGHPIELIIHSFDKKNERVTLNFPEIEKPNIALPNQWEKSDWNSIKNKLVKDIKINGVITSIVDYGVYVFLEMGYEGLLHNRQIPENMIIEKNKPIVVEILSIDYINREVSLKL